MNVVCHIQNEMHRDYLHSIFAYEDGAFSVFRDTKIGRFICSMVSVSEFPVEQKVVEEKAVYFRLPKTSALPSLFQRFCYITPEDQRKINDFIVANFDLDYMTYYHAGITLGLQQKIVIQNFIIARKLVSRIGEVEQLKKRAYRADEKKINTLVNRLKQRVKVQNAIITKTIQDYQSIIT